MPVLVSSTVFPSRVDTTVWIDLFPLVHLPGTEGTFACVDRDRVRGQGKGGRAWEKLLIFLKK